MICSKCGLPAELCVCVTIAKEAQKIKITLVQKRYGKYMTVIKGIDKKKIDIRDLMKKLKSKLACGGTYKNDEITLQGDHRDRIKSVLITEGFPADIIEVI
ncbi:MAG: translation initiation factor [Candidatus Aenigmarchaeota archaeon]|nr:translation initiation factor [Candidatus Aenigmarchaeota archaeon]MDI6722037.1 translation initiation factor [Candidatus Aenigmarchaeota archaeon]